MTQRYEIGELDKKGVVLSLTPTERRALAHLTDTLRVACQSVSSALIFAPVYVSTIALSSGTTLTVTPKVPIANILALASLGYRTVPIPAAVGNALLDSVEPVVDWLAV